MHLPFYFHHHFFISHAKHISWECKYNFDVKKCDSNQIWNNNKCWPDSKNPKEHRCTKNIILEILLHVVVEMTNI